MAEESQRSRGSVNTLSFLDLPPEIRNTVYHLVLVHEKPVIVDRTAYARRMHGGGMTMGLLRANREIHHEATPVFYGANYFGYNGGPWMADDRTLLQWLTKIGNSRRHLRKIGVVHVGDREVLSSALDLLKDAKNLETLLLGKCLLHQFVGDEWARNRGFPPVAREILLPWLRHLQESRKGSEDARPVLSVLQHTDSQVEEGRLIYLTSKRVEEVNANTETLLARLITNLVELDGSLA